MNKEALEKTSNKKWMTIIGIILCLLMIPVLVVNITIIIKSYVDPDKVPGFLGYKPFIVLSDSMNPGIQTGDLVLSRETDTGKLTVGDVVTYRVGDSVVTHRIVGITDKDGALSFTTRGDANNADDTNPVDATMIEGRVLINIPKLGNAALFMQTPAGMLICIGIPVLLLVGYDILRRRRYDKEKRLRTSELEKELELMRAQVKTN